MHLEDATPGMEGYRFEGGRLREDDVGSGQRRVPTHVHLNLGSEPPEAVVALPSAAQLSEKGRLTEIVFAGNGLPQHKHPGMASQERRDPTRVCMQNSGTG
jgi:hypothetical protein